MSSNFDHDVKPTDITARLLISVISYATLLENQFSDWLLPPPQGVYTPGSSIPSLVPNRHYFVKTDSGMALVTNIDEIVADVFDVNHKVVLNRYVMQNKNRMLTPHPTIPVRGIQLIQKLIEFEITKILRWCPHAHGYENRILTEFKPEFRSSVDIQVIREAGRYITQQVHEFIGRDDWNYYHTSISGVDIVIEKGPDYRVCEWYQMMARQNQQHEY